MPLLTWDVVLCFVDVDVLYVNGIQYIVLSLIRWSASFMFFYFTLNRISDQLADCGLGAGGLNVH